MLSQNIKKRFSIGFKPSFNQYLPLKPEFETKVLVSNQT